MTHSQPRTNNQQGQHSADKLRENVTNVRKGKDLIAAAVDALDKDRCRTAVIQPQGQKFFLDCRIRSTHELLSDISGFGINPGNFGRWLARSMERHGNYTFQPHLPPQSMNTAHFLLSPANARLLADELHGELNTDRANSGTVIHLLLIEGASAKAIQKFCFAYSASEAASTAFHALANGYSVSIAGAILVEDLNRLHERHAGIERVSTLEKLRELTKRQREEHTWCGDRSIGVIF
jgi:hypothetical protein